MLLSMLCKFVNELFYPGPLSTISSLYRFVTFLFHFCSYALFDMEGNQVPQELVTKVGEVFEVILEEAS